MEDLIRKYLEGKASAKDESDLLAFRKAGEENERLFKERVAIWEEQRIEDDAPDGGYMQLLDAISSRKRVRAWNFAVTIAAAVVLFVIAGFSIVQATASYRDMLTVSVPLGEHTCLFLSDGSKVWVNAGSTLTYPREFRKRNRIVELQGEGYFEVEASPRSRFIVRAGECTFTVKGTKFDINAYPEEKKVCAVLMEGKLEFKAGSFDYAMSEGELVSCGIDGLKRRDVDALQYQGWTQHIIRFDKITLPELLRRVSREFDTRISLETDLFDYREIKASFSKEYTVERILCAISNFLPITYSRDEDGTWHVTNK